MTDTKPSTTKAEMVEALQRLGGTYALGNMPMFGIIRECVALAKRLPDSPPACAVAHEATEAEPELTALIGMTVYNAMQANRDSIHGTRVTIAWEAIHEGVSRAIIAALVERARVAASTKPERAKAPIDPVQRSSEIQREEREAERRRLLTPRAEQPEREAFDAARVQQEPGCSHSTARADESTSAAEARPAFDEAAFERTLLDVETEDAGVAFRLARLALAKGASMSEIAKAAVGGSDGD